MASPLPVLDFELLSPLHEAWVRGFLGTSIPRESRATCSTCPMIGASDGGSGPTRITFNPSTKCCTYTPELPNFLVGGILSDRDLPNGFGQTSVRARMAAGISVTPLGIGVPPTVAHLYSTIGDNVFGRSDRLRCPHYSVDSGGCSIWRHRNSVCMTWFCRHVRGPRGFHFWGQLKELPKAVELELAIYCVHQLIDDSAQLASILENKQRPTTERIVEELTGSDATRYAEIWGRWLEREQEFYAQCDTIVQQMNWVDVQAICGAEVAARARCVRAAFQDLYERPLPGHVEVAPGVASALSGEASTVTVQAGTDTLEVSRTPLRRLGELERCSPAALLDERQNSEGILDQKTLVALLDFGVLQAS